MKTLKSLVVTYALNIVWLLENRYENRMGSYMLDFEYFQSKMSHVVIIHAKKLRWMLDIPSHISQQTNRLKEKKKQRADGA